MTHNCTLSVTASGSCEKYTSIYAVSWDHTWD